MKRLALAIVAAACIGSPAAARDLTVAQFREVLAISGFNPGTSRMIGGLGVYRLQSVKVTDGQVRGEFVIKVRVVPQMVPTWQAHSQ